MQHGRSGKQYSPIAAQIDRTKRPRLTCESARKPNFLAVGRPCQTLYGTELLGQHFPISLVVDHIDESAIVAQYGMIHKSDFVTRGRKAHIADVAVILVQHLSDRELELVVVPN